MKKVTLLLLSIIFVFTWTEAFAKKLYVGTDIVFVPFEYKGKNGRYTGFAIELWAEIAKA